MKLLSTWTLILMAAMALMPASVLANHTKEPPATGTHAEAVALIDVTSGRILYSNNGDAELRIASLTKIMTAIVAIENGELSDIVTVGPKSFGKEGSSIYLKLDEEMSLENMLYGLMLRSGNDAATAIAEHVGGSEEGFVHMMNDKARDLGLTHTSFMNPHGLDAEGHYSSANDLAVLTAYALQNATFKEIVSTRSKRVPNPDEKWDRVWRNKNKMLSLFEGADGVKTGYTKLAKRCLVSSATRDGHQLAVVTINDGDDWLDHSRLLEWGFTYYSQTTLIEQGQAAPESTLVAARSFRYPLYDGEEQHIAQKVELTPADSVDYRLGDRGKLHFYLNDQLIGTVLLIESPAHHTIVDPAKSGGFAHYLNTIEIVFAKLFTLQ